MENAVNIYDFEKFEPLLRDKGLVEAEMFAEIDADAASETSRLTIADLTKKEAERLYYEEHKNFQDMAKKYNTSYYFLRKKFFQLGCKARTRSEISKEINKKYKINITKEKLYELYYSQKKSHYEIATIFGCTSTIISRRMKEFEMSVREPEERDEIAASKKRFDIKKEDIETLINKGFCCEEIAEQLKVSASVIVARVAKFQINREKLDLTIRKRRGGSFEEDWTPKTPLNEAIRTSSKYIKWRDSCFARDQYTCQHCNIKGTQLQVDHIKPFCFIITKYNIKSLEEAKKCLKLWDINNGRTLCVKCHKLTDTFTRKALKYKEGNIDNV